MTDNRTDTARAHDDSDLIDAMGDDSAGVPSTSGGDLARDVGSRDELNAVDDPDGSARVTKQDSIDAGVAEPANRSSGENAPG